MVDPPAAAIGLEAGPGRAFRRDHRQAGREGLGGGEAEVFVEGRQGEELRRLQCRGLVCAVSGPRDLDIGQGQAGGQGFQLGGVPALVRTDDAQGPAARRRARERPAPDQAVEALLRMDTAEREDNARRLGRAPDGCWNIDAVGNDHNRVGQSHGADLGAFLLTGRMDEGGGLQRPLLSQGPNHSFLQGREPHGVGAQHAPGRDDERLASPARDDGRRYVGSQPKTVGVQDVGPALRLGRQRPAHGRR